MARSLSGRPLSVAMMLNSRVTSGVKLRMTRLTVEKNGCDLAALEQIAHIGIGAVKVFDLGVKLVVDGLQFLVERLQLFLGSFELFIARLHFLVERDQLLIGRFELLQRCFIFLYRSLQALARVAQFDFEACVIVGWERDLRRGYRLSR